MVFIEGPDNSGKTTLVEKLVKEGYWLKMQNTSNRLLIGSNAASQLRERGVIWDRSRVISECVYGQVLRGHVALSEETMMQFMNHSPLVIYCRPPNWHIMNNQGREQMDGVLENHEALIKAYDKLMEELRRFGVRVVEYDWTKPNSLEKVKTAIDKEFERQREVHAQALLMIKPQNNLYKD